MERIELFGLDIKDGVITAQNMKVTLKTSDIVKVMITTNDQGPFLDDVFLCLYTDDGAEYWISQDSPEFMILYGYVSKFEGFDYQTVIKAMQCTDNEEFLCWEKK